MKLIFSLIVRLGAGAPAIGIPFFWPLVAMPNTVMDEWSDMVFLKPNGASFSAATYPKLAKVWTGLIIPDMRGEFLRIWDDGRGVDPGRELLSFQGDAIRNITASMGASGSFYDAASTVFSGAFGQTYRQQKALVTTGGSASFTGFDFSADRVVATASENRPRSIALNFLIRAK